MGCIVHGKGDTMTEEIKGLREQSQARFQRIWEIYQAGGDLEGEDARLAEVMERHPEYHEIWERAEALGSEDVVVDEVNPFMHATVHTTVENQLAEGSPPEAAEALDALLKAGYSRHEAIHFIGAVVTDEIYNILKEDRPADNEAVAANLRDLTRQARREARRGSGNGSGKRG